jgi:hypothetical protein
VPSLGGICCSTRLARRALTFWSRVLCARAPSGRSSPSPVQHRPQRRTRIHQGRQQVQESPSSFWSLDSEPVRPSEARSEQPERARDVLAPLHVEQFERLVVRHGLVHRGGIVDLAHRTCPLRSRPVGAVAEELVRSCPARCASLLDTPGCPAGHAPSLSRSA